MKKLKPTKAWILLCSLTVFMSVAAEHFFHHNGLPYHRTSTPQRKKIQLPALPVTVQIPEHVMSREEVSCISADRNIFEIMKQANQNCYGKDMVCTFYYFANHKYYNIGTLEIDKELFDGLLMKYDNWLLTAEKFHLRDTEKYLQDRYLKFYVKNSEHKSHMGSINMKEKLTGHDTFTPTDSYATGEEKNSKDDRSFYIDKCDNDMYYYNAVNAADMSDDSDINNDILKENTENIKLNKNYHKTHTNKDSRTVINVQEKNGKTDNYIKLEPKYNNAHNHFEVFLPAHKENAQSKTINVEINNENKNYLFFEEEFDEKNEYYKPLQIEFKEDTSTIAELDTNLYNNSPLDNDWRFAQSSINERENKGNIRKENSNHGQNFGISDINTDFSDIPIVNNNENDKYFTHSNMIMENETSDTHFNKNLSNDLNTDIQAERIDNNPMNNMPIVQNLKTYKVTSGNDQEIVIQNDYSTNDYNIKNMYHRKTDIKNAPTEDTNTIIQPTNDIDYINVKEISQETTLQENNSDNSLKYKNKYQVYPNNPEDYSTTDNAFSQTEDDTLTVRSYDIDSKIYNFNGNQKIIPGDTTKNGKNIVNFSENVAVPNKYVNQAKYYVESELDNKIEEKIPTADILTKVLEESSHTPRNNDNIEDLNTIIEQNDQLNTKRIDSSDKENLQHSDEGNILNPIKNSIDRKSDFKDTETPEIDQNTEKIQISKDDGLADDALVIKPVENIYSAIDFDDTHDFSTHKNDILSSSHIHHNEPVFQVEKPFRENIMKAAPYVFALPKSYTSHPHTTSSAYIDLEQELSITPNQPIGTAPSYLPILTTPLYSRTLTGKEFSKTAEPKSQLESESTLLPSLVNSLSDLDDSQNSPEFVILSEPDTRQFTSAILPAPPIESVMLLNIGSEKSPFNVGFSWLPSYSRIEELRTPSTIPQLKSSLSIQIPSIEELSANNTPMSVSPDHTLIDSGLPSFGDGDSESLTNNNLRTTTPVSQEQTSSALESDLSPSQPISADSARIPSSALEYTTPLTVSPFRSRAMNLPNSVQQSLHSPYALLSSKTSPLDLGYLKTLPFDINSYRQHPITNQMQLNNPLSANIIRHPYVTPQLIQPFIKPLPASKIPLDSLLLSRLHETNPNLDEDDRGNEPIIVPTPVSSTPLVHNLRTYPLLESSFLQSSPISSAEPTLLAKIPKYIILPKPSVAYTEPVEKNLQNFVPSSTANSDLPQSFTMQQDKILEPTSDKGAMLNEDFFQNTPSSYKPSPLSSSAYTPLVKMDSTAPLTSSHGISDLTSPYSKPVSSILIGSPLTDQDSLVRQSKLSLLPTVPLKITAQATPHSNLEQDNEIIDPNNSLSPTTVTDLRFGEDTQSKQLGENLPSDLITFQPLESPHATPQLDSGSTPLIIDSSKQPLNPFVKHITTPLVTPDSLQYTDVEQVSQPSETNSNIPLPSNQQSTSPLLKKQQPKYLLDQPVYMNEKQGTGGSETILINEEFDELSSDKNIPSESYPKSSPSVERGLDLNRKSSQSIEPNLQLPSTVSEASVDLITESLADRRIPSSLYNGPNIDAYIPEIVRPNYELLSQASEIFPSLVPTTSQLDDSSRMSPVLNSESQKPISNSQYENSIRSLSLDSISAQLDLKTVSLPSDLISEEFPLDSNILQSSIPISSLINSSPLLKPILSSITSNRLSKAAESPTENTYLPASLLPSHSPALLPLPPTLTSSPMSNPFLSLPLPNIPLKEIIPQLSSFKGIQSDILPSSLIPTHLTQIPYISYPYNVPLSPVSKLLPLPADCFNSVLGKSSVLEAAPKLLLTYTPNYCSTPLPSYTSLDINPKPSSTPILQSYIPLTDNPMFPTDLVESFPLPDFTYPIDERKPILCAPSSKPMLDLKEYPSNAVPHLDILSPPVSLPDVGPIASSSYTNPILSSKLTVPSLKQVLSTNFLEDNLKPLTHSIPHLVIKPQLSSMPVLQYNTPILPSLSSPTTQPQFTQPEFLQLSHDLLSSIAKASAVNKKPSLLSTDLQPLSLTTSLDSSVSLLNEISSESQLYPDLSILDIRTPTFIKPILELDSITPTSIYTTPPNFWSQDKIPQLPKTIMTTFPSNLASNICSANYNPTSPFAITDEDSFQFLEESANIMPKIQHATAPKTSVHDDLLPQIDEFSDLDECLFQPSMLSPSLTSSNLLSQANKIPSFYDNLPFKEEFFQNIPHKLQNILPTPPRDTSLLLNADSIQNILNMQYPVSGVKVQPFTPNISLDIVPIPSDINSLLNTDFTEARPVSHKLPSSSSVYTSPQLVLNYLPNPLLERQRPSNIKVQKFKPVSSVLPAYNNISLNALFSQNLGPVIQLDESLNVLENELPLSTYNTPLIETETLHTTQPYSLPLPKGTVVPPDQVSTYIAADVWKDQNAPDSVYIPTNKLQSPPRYSRPLSNTDTPLIPTLDSEFIENSNIHNVYPSESSLVYSRPLLNLDASKITPNMQLLDNNLQYGIPSELLGPISSDLDIEIIQSSSQLSAMSSQLSPIDILSSTFDTNSEPTQLPSNLSVEQYSAPCSISPMLISPAYQSPLSLASNRPLSSYFTSSFSPASIQTSAFKPRPLSTAYPIPLSPAYPITLSSPYIKLMSPTYIDPLLPVCSNSLSSAYTSPLSLPSRNRLMPSYTDSLSPTYFEPIISAYPSKLSRGPISQQIPVSPAFADTLSPLSTSSLLSPVPSQQVTPQPAYSGFISQPLRSPLSPIYADPSSLNTNAVTCPYASQLAPVYANSPTPTVSPIYKIQQYTRPLSSLVSNGLLNIPQMTISESEILRPMTTSLFYATSPFKNINQSPICLSKIRPSSFSPVSSSQINMNDLLDISTADISDIPSLTSAPTYNSSIESICTENNEIYEDYSEEPSLVTPLKSTPNSLVCEEVPGTLLEEDLVQDGSQIPLISVPCLSTATVLETKYQEPHLFTPFVHGTLLSQPRPTPKSVPSQLISRIPVCQPCICKNMPLEPNTLSPLPVSPTFIHPDLPLTIGTNLPLSFQPSSPIKPLDSGPILSSGRHPICNKPQSALSYSAPYLSTPSIDFSKISRNPPIVEFASRTSSNSPGQIVNIGMSQVTPQFSEAPSVAPLSPLQSYMKPISSTVSSPSKTQLTVPDIIENYMSLSPTYSKLTSNTPLFQESLLQPSSIPSLNKYQTPFTSPSTKPLLNTFLQSLRKPHSSICPQYSTSPALTWQNTYFSPLIPIGLKSAPIRSEKYVTLPTTLITPSSESDVSKNSSIPPDFLTSSQTRILPALSQTFGNSFPRTDGSVPTNPQSLPSPTSQYLLLQESPSLPSSLVSSQTLTPISAIPLSTDQTKLQQTPYLQSVSSTSTSSLSPPDTNFFQNIKPSSVNNVPRYSYPSSYTKPIGIIDFEQIALKPSMLTVSHAHYVPFSNTKPLVHREFVNPVKSRNFPVSSLIRIPQSSLVLPFNSPPLETSDFYQSQPIPEPSSASSVSYDTLSLPSSYTTPSLATHIHNTIEHQILHRPSNSQHRPSVNPAYDTPIYVLSSLKSPLSNVKVKTSSGVPSSSIQGNRISQPILALSDTKQLLPILQSLDNPDSDVLPDLYSSQIIPSAPIHSSSLVKPFTHTVTPQKLPALQFLSPSYSQYLPQSLLSELSPQLPTVNVPQLLPLTSFTMKNPVPRPLASGRPSSTYGLPKATHTSQYQTLDPSIPCDSQLSSIEPLSLPSPSPILKSLSTPLGQYSTLQHPHILNPLDTYTSIVPSLNSGKLPTVKVPQYDYSHSQLVTTIPDTMNISPILPSSYSPSPLLEENIVQEAIPIKVPSMSTSKYDILDSSLLTVCPEHDTDTMELTELNQPMSDLLSPLDLSQQRQYLPISAPQYYPLPSTTHKALPKPLSPISSMYPIFSNPYFSTPSFIPVKNKLMGTADFIPTFTVSSKPSILGNSDHICSHSSPDETSTYLPTDLFQNIPLSTLSINSLQSDLLQLSTLTSPQSNTELEPKLDKCCFTELLTSPVSMSTDLLQESETNQQSNSVTNNPQYNTLTPLLPPVLLSSPQILSSPNVKQSSTYYRDPLATSSLISQLPVSTIPNYKFSPLISLSQISPMLDRAYAQNRLQMPIMETLLPLNRNPLEITPYKENLLQNNLDKYRFPSYIESNNLSPLDIEELKSSSELPVETNILEVKSKTIRPLESTVYTEYEENNNLNEGNENYSEYTFESEDVCLDASSNEADINNEEYFNENYKDIESFNKVAHYLFDKPNLKITFADLTSTNPQDFHEERSKANNIDSLLNIEATVDNTISSDFNIDTRIMNSILPDSTDIYEEIPESYADATCTKIPQAYNINSLKTLPSTQPLPSAECCIPLMDKSLSQNGKIPQYHPFMRHPNNLPTYTSFVSTSKDYNNPPRILTKPNLDTPQVTQYSTNIPDIKIIPKNLKRLSEHDNFYANNHIGKSPQVFSVPTFNNINSNNGNSETTLAVSSSPDRVCSGIRDDSIGIPTIHFGSPPKTDKTLALNEYYSSVPDILTADSQISSYNTINPSLKSSPKFTLPPRILAPRIDRDFNKLTPDDSSAFYNNMGNIKYSGYKTFQIPTPKTSDWYGRPSPSQIFVPTTINQPLPTIPLYQKPIPNIAVKMATPLQTKLGLINLQQSSKLNEYIPFEDIGVCEKNIDTMTRPLQTKLGLSNLQQSSKSIEYNPIENIPVCENIINTITTPIQTNLGLSHLQQSSKSDEYNPIEDIPICTNSIDLNDELKTNLINYINRNEDLKNKLNGNNNELSIPIRNLVITKKVPCIDYTIQTKNPSIGLKVWKSNVKVVEAEIKLKFKDLSVTNFMPVVNNLNEYDIAEIRNIVKSYIDEKYGNHIEVNEPYTIDNEYTVIKDFDQNSIDNKYNILWPTDYV